MSITLMSAVFKLEGLPPNQKLVLLKFADHANDDGLNCYPSLSRVAKETSLSTRTVERIVATFRDDEHRVLVPLEAACGGRGKRGKGVSYRLDIRRAQELYANPRQGEAETSDTETPDKLSEVSEKPPTAGTETSDTGDENLRHQVADKPSSNHQEPSGAPGRARSPKGGGATPGAGNDAQTAERTKACTVWEQHLDAIKAAVPGRPFRAWLHPIIPLTDDGKTLVLGCVSRFACQFIELEYAEIVSRITGRRIVCEFRTWVGEAVRDRDEREARRGLTKDEGAGA